VLSPSNAVAYFAPSAQIKRFADRSSWRGRARLPKYRKSFREFWEHHVEDGYLVGGAAVNAGIKCDSSWVKSD
jgi:hypothetical protein